MLAGVDWITEDNEGSSIANMSGGLDLSDPDNVEIAPVLEDAIRASIADGVTYIVSAGNDNADACDYSPGRIPETITVGATTDADSRWTSSNYGTCIDIFAPGYQIASAFVVDESGNKCTSCEVTANGTSGAAPFVAGVAALYLEDHPGATPTEVRDHLLQTATSGALSDIGSGSPNLLVFTEAVLTGAISGPSQVEDLKSYTWYSVVDGGDYSYSYEWARRYRFDDGTEGDWTVLGTEPDLIYYVTGGSPDFELRLRIASGSQNIARYQDVYVTSCTTACIESVGGEPVAASK